MGRMGFCWEDGDFALGRMGLWDYLPFWYYGEVARGSEGLFCLDTVELICFWQHNSLDTVEGIIYSSIRHCRVFDRYSLLLDTVGEGRDYLFFYFE